MGVAKVSISSNDFRYRKNSYMNKKDKAKLKKVLKASLIATPQNYMYVRNDLDSELYKEFIKPGLHMNELPTGEEIEALPEFQSFIKKLPKVLAIWIKMKFDHSKIVKQNGLDKKLIIDEVSEKLSKKDFKRFKEVFYLTNELNIAPDDDGELL